ncbi:MAG: hypothetical protein ABJZ62_07190 [Hyphomicrobiales bacterium]
MVRYISFWKWVFSAIVILIIGYWLEQNCQNYHFQRSGSLVVFLAIFIEARALKFLYQSFLNGVESRNKELDAIRSNHELLWQCLNRLRISRRVSMDETMEAADKLIDQRDGNYVEANEFKESALENSKAFEGMSIVAFITGLSGTIVWGYGDIIMKWITKI